MVFIVVQKVAGAIAATPFLSGGVTVATLTDTAMTLAARDSLCSSFDEARCRLRVEQLLTCRLKHADTTTPKIVT